MRGPLHFFLFFYFLLLGDRRMQILLLLLLLLLLLHGFDDVKAKPTGVSKFEWNIKLLTRNGVYVLIYFSVLDK
ncbi:hypothetical protein QBC42DRAFT_275443 [Cladorrhinum samala]|uniref:Uncharacterized protein n=1 Tax=Cladorrhinum samala TaxID=585594 RepID=A0AAV9HGG4_9PEZI|nr:hypothetical protein QBC42DRAFT_275443 [Cladorrhinum samala]